MEEGRGRLLQYNLQWFAKDGPGGEKTEPATAKKLKEAREDGKVAKSKELTAAFDLIVLFLVLKIFMSTIGNGFIEIFQSVYTLMPDFVSINAMDVSEQSITNFMYMILVQMIKIVAPFFVFGFAITLLINIIQVGWKVSAKPMKPKADRFNPINGFKRIFSKDSIFELLKSILKIAVIIYVAYSAIKDHANDIFILYDISLNQKYRFNEDMKMTKQEVKDEYKNTEGNPEIKGRQRQRMREASRRRMMQDVPKADVVITNPTHLAVAIKYEPEVNRAPIVLAKGEDFMAQKIREAAKENNIKIIENKPLARMLYANVDIGGEIPPELYQAVAEILAMVYNTRQ